ncbi:ABC transporter permease subunit/CPBP intramembrane protease [Calycomorphotria hydatis]|uniref:ABC-2 family transporter protein n=1 Tax=Calycomorphotria hydatis TaxID=2528027 RepID=A0A517T8D0_9PLAN|nr:ABC transporter permease subunit/CPBP intramembrane protease [Calycomorphotria hydatis]QDT64634.1 ABC-2 family transporter protein [Calycomorphotria hydatis]
MTTPPNKSVKHQTEISSAILWRLILKELKETLRDRRTTFTLVAMPILVYPLLGIVLQKFVLAQLGETSKLEYVVACASPDEAARFQALLITGEQLLAEEEPRSETGPNGQPLDPALLSNPKAKEFEVKTVVAEPGTSREELEFYVLTGQAAVAVFAPPDDEKILSDEVETYHDYPVNFELIIHNGDAFNEDAAKFIGRRFDAVNERYLRDVLAAQEDGAPLGLPAQFETTAIGEPPEAGFSLASLVPLVLVLMTITGAVYPAIDLTAGERERGTLEPLIATPLPRRALLSAKYVAVVTVALLTALMNVFAMFVTIYSTGLDSLVFGDRGITLLIIMQLLALLLLFAAFFSAVLLCLTSFARSFKEAQAYLIPLMLVSLAPGIFSLLPGMQLNLFLALVPLANIVLLARDLLGIGIELLPALVAVFSTLLYTWLALSLAVRIFGTDAILYGSEGSWSELWTRPKHERDVPSPTEAILLTGILVPMFLILGSLPGRFGELSIAARLVMGSVITIFLFALLPAIVASYRNLKLSSTFRGTTAPWLAFVVALLFGISLWPFAFELELLLISESLLEQMKQFFEPWKAQLAAVPLALKLFCLAIVPAVCEELYFRGFLFSALKRRMSGLVTVVITAFLFAAFHVLVRDGLLLGRFPPTFFLGLMLGVLALRSGSVWPGIMMHVLNNGLLLVIAHYESQLAGWGIAMEEREHLPATWLLAAGLCVAIGAGLLLLVRGRNSIESTANSDE